MVLAYPLLASACLFDPAWLGARLETDALSAVASRTKVGSLGQLDLRVTPNPWGCGVLVLSHKAAGPDDVLLWFHCPDGQATPRREATFAFDERAAALAQGLTRLDSASEEMQRALGMNLVSRDEVRETVFVAIQRRISVHEARSQVARH